VIIAGAGVVEAILGAILGIVVTALAGLAFDVSLMRERLARVEEAIRRMNGRHD